MFRAIAPRHSLFQQGTFDPYQLVLYQFSGSFSPTKRHHSFFSPNKTKCSPTSASVATIDNCDSTNLTMLVLTLLRQFALRFLTMQNPGINDLKKVAAVVNIKS